MFKFPLSTTILSPVIMIIILIISCFIMMIINPVSSQQDRGAPEDKAILLKLIPILTGRQDHPNSFSKCFESWKQTSDLCSEFEGIKCDQITGIHVAEIYLRGCDLRGEFPSDMSLLPNLPHLSSISLQDNYLTGTLPGSVIANLPQLTSFVVYNNYFVGNVPYQFGNLYNLLYLDISDNNLNGDLPHQLSGMKVIRDINFAKNRLFSTQVPESWASLKSTLKTLDVSDNCVAITPTLLNTLTESGAVLVDATPRCMKMAPLQTTRQLASPYRYQIVNSFGDDPQKCTDVMNFFGCDSNPVRPLVLHERSGFARYSLSLVCGVATETSTGVDPSSSNENSGSGSSSSASNNNNNNKKRSNPPLTFLSSCITALYVVTLECFIDPEGTQRCPESSMIDFPFWHNQTVEVQMSPNAMFSFDQASESTYLYGVYYRLNFHIGVNFVLPPENIHFKNEKYDKYANEHYNGNKFQNFHVLSPTYQARPCSQQNSAAINMTTYCTACPMYGRCDGSVDIRIGKSPAWRPYRHLLPFYSCNPANSKGCPKDRGTNFTQRLDRLYKLLIAREESRGEKNANSGRRRETYNNNNNNLFLKEEEEQESLFQSKVFEFLSTNNNNNNDDVQEDDELLSSTKHNHTHSKHNNHNKHRSYNWWRKFWRNSTYYREIKHLENEEFGVQCLNHYEGPLCMHCETNYGLIDGECLECPSRFVTIIIFVLGITVLIVLATLLIHLSIRPTKLVVVPDSSGNNNSSGNISKNDSSRSNDNTNSQKVKRKQVFVKSSVYLRGKESSLLSNPENDENDADLPLLSKNDNNTASSTSSFMRHQQQQQPKNIQQEQEEEFSDKEADENEEGKVTTTTTTNNNDNIYDEENDNSNNIDNNVEEEQDDDDEEEEEEEEEEEAICLVFCPCNSDISCDPTGFDMCLPLLRKLKKYRPQLERLAVAIRQLINHMSLVGALDDNATSHLLAKSVQKLLSAQNTATMFLFGSYATALQCLFPKMSNSVLHFNLILGISCGVFILEAIFFFVFTRRISAIFSVVVFMSYICYSPLTNNSFRLLSLCTEYKFWSTEDYLLDRATDDNVRYRVSVLSSDLVQECSDEFSQTYVVAAAITIVFFSIGLPVSIALGYKSNYLKHHPKLRESIFGFLTKEYEDHGWFWELVEMGRKLVVAVISGVIPNAAALQLQLYSATCACMLALSCSENPLRGVAANRALQTSFISAILCAATMSLTAAFPNNDAVEIITTIVVFATQIIAVAAILIYGGGGSSSQTSQQHHGKSENQRNRSESRTTNKNASFGSNIHSNNNSIVKNTSLAGLNNNNSLTSNISTSSRNKKRRRAQSESEAERNNSSFSQEIVCDSNTNTTSNNNCVNNNNNAAAAVSSSGKVAGETKANENEAENNSFERKSNFSILELSVAHDNAAAEPDK